jgi:membrane-associated phospholipid phosphatase
MGMTGVLLLYANVCINIKIFEYFMSILLNLFKQLGSYGPIILILLSMFILWDSHNLFFYYIVGLFVNTILNLLIKAIIQQPRPSEYTENFHLALTHGKRFLFNDGIPFNIFGMPSGHAQASFFSVVFVFLSTKQYNLLYFYTLFSLLIIIQRVYFNYHTILQVMVGAIVGSVFAYFVYYLAREKIKGHITEKKDDNGPI